MYYWTGARQHEIFLLNSPASLHWKKLSSLCIPLTWLKNYGDTVSFIIVQSFITLSKWSLIRFKLNYPTPIISLKQFHSQKCSTREHLFYLTYEDVHYPERSIQWKHRGKESQEPGRGIHCSMKSLKWRRESNNEAKSHLQFMYLVCLLSLTEITPSLLFVPRKNHSTIIVTMIKKR